MTGNRYRAHRASRLAWIPAALLLCLAPAGAAAQQPPATGQDVVHLQGAGGSTGVTNVNVAAGNNNQQMNVGVIAAGDAASAAASGAQRTTASSRGGGRSAIATIDGNAFANSSGWTAVNVVSGSDNQQANMAVIAFGIEGRVVTDTMLSQTRASQEPIGSAGEAAVPERVTGLSPGAFENSSGLVQLSLVGGDRNSSANTFALSVSAGAKP